MKATCACGKSFNAPDKLAGKTVKCPSCGGVLSIPDTAPTPTASAPIGSIVVQCSGCSGRFNAPPNLARQQISCPTCGHAIAVPGQLPMTQPTASPDPLGLGSQNPDGFGTPLGDPFVAQMMSQNSFDAATQSRNAPVPDSSNSKRKRTKINLRDIYCSIFGEPVSTHSETLFFQIAIGVFTLVLIFCSMEMVEGWGFLELEWPALSFYAICVVMGLLCGFFIGGPHWLPGMIATPIAGLGSLGVMGALLASLDVIHDIMLLIAGLIGAVPGALIFVLLMQLQDHLEGN